MIRAFGRRGNVILLLASALSLFAVACSAFHDWEDDHLVINELELLQPNELWVELRDVRAEPIECSFAICQNVLRGVRYEVIGDLELAKAAAVDELLQSWVPTSDDVDPLTAESVHLQLRDHVEIDTTTGTAFMRLAFRENSQVGFDDFRPTIGIAVSSDSKL